MTRSALLVGATGLVGRHCLDALLADDAYHAVTTLGRRPLDCAHAKLVHHTIDFDHLDLHDDFLGAQDVFCCLGTTMAQAGSKEAFRRVDHDYPLRLAQRAHGCGAEQYLLVSALGADADSWIFYNQVKGEVEAAISAVPFAGVYLFRPSLLIGERPNPRTGEQVAETLMNAFSFVFQGPLRKYRPTPADAVARGMVTVAKAQPGGVRIYEPDAIEEVLTEG